MNKQTKILTAILVASICGASIAAPMQGHFGTPQPLAGANGCGQQLWIQNNSQDLIKEVTYFADSSNAQKKIPSGASYTYDPIKPKFWPLTVYLYDWSVVGHPLLRTVSLSYTGTAYQKVTIGPRANSNDKTSLPTVDIDSRGQL